MTLKTTIRSLSFVLAASVSSFALAQGLGVRVGLGADAHVGAGNTKVDAGAQLGSDVPSGSRSAVTVARTGANADASTSTDTNVRATPGVELGSAVKGVAGASAIGEGASLAANANAGAHASVKKIKKATHVSSSPAGGVKAGVDASTQGDVKAGY